MKKQYLEILKEIEKAGKLALKLQKDLQITKKGDGIDVVTQADKEIEQRIYKKISKIFPDDGFWGEEDENLRKDSEYIWYVDPIDGTKYFAANIPLWSISVARVKKGEKIPQFSAIYIPKEDSLFYAEMGKGVYLNSKKLSSSKSSEINKTTLAFDFSPSKDGGLNTFVYNKFPKLLDNFYRVRFLGVGTLNTVWTTTGFFGVFIKYLQGTKQYNDVVAGLLIAQESGLKVDYQKLKNGLERIIICNKENLEEIQKILE